MRRLVVRVAALLAVPLAGCGGGGTSGVDAPEPTAASAGITVTSPAFEQNGPIPAQYTCHGSGISPALRWSGVPADARALALVVDDPDAPHGTYTHWVVVDVPTSTDHVDAGSTPSGGTELTASGGAGWSPPCPPSGTHHYRFHVYALRTELGLPSDTSIARAMRAIGAHTVSWGLLTGTVTASGGDSGGY